MKIKTVLPVLGSRGVKFELFVKRAKTGLVEAVKKGHNLILDSGLTKWGSVSTGSLTAYCAVGTGTTAVERDSATTTASRTGTTVTSSGGFFEANDVGRLIKWDTGETDYITTFTSTTEVETANSGAIAASEFTIWYVEQTTLDAETARTNSYRTDTGDNSSTESAGVIDYKRTHLFSAVGSPVTYNEIGWTDESSGGTLFNRAIISGGVSLGTGDQLIVVSHLEVVQSPQTSTPQADVGAGGYDTTGDAQIEGYGLSGIQSSGLVTSQFNGLDNSSQSLEPKAQQSDGITTYVSSSSTAFSTYGTVFTIATTKYNKSFTRGGITTVDDNTRQRLRTAVFPTTAANDATHRSIGMGYGSNNAASQQCQSAFRVLMDAFQEKTNSETLTLVFAVRWGRILTNS